MPDIFVADPNKTRQNVKKQETEAPKSTAPPPDPAKAEEVVIKTAKEEKIQDIKRDVGIFHSYCVDPSGVTFANQDQDEKILLFLRAHFITNIPWLLRTAVLLILPIVLSFVLNMLGIELNFLPTTYIMFMLIFYFYAVILFAFVDFITWFFNFGLVTNIRVMDVDLKGLVQTHVAATKIGQIEDVSYRRTGALRSIFDYGDVEIQTAAETENFDFAAVPKPNQTVNIVEDLIRSGGE